MLLFATEVFYPKTEISSVIGWVVQYREWKTPVLLERGDFENGKLQES
jgi:hypothetical protein